MFCLISEVIYHVTFFMVKKNGSRNMFITVWKRVFYKRWNAQTFYIYTTNKNASLLKKLEVKLMPLKLFTLHLLSPNYL